MAVIAAGLLARRQGQAVQRLLERQAVELKARQRELEAQQLELLEFTQSQAQQKLELEERHRELEHLSTAKSEFLAAISHELRTPLNAVIGFAELLTDGVAGQVNDAQREYLGDIRSAGTHLLRLINDILDYSKAEAGKLVLEQVVVGLRRPVEEAVEMLEATARKKGVTLAVSCEDDVSALGDPLRLKQVVVNLVANAVKFTPKGGAVTVTLAGVGGDRAQVSVRDTGIGMSPEQQAQLFTAFHQVDHDVSRRFEGTGLGLALAKQLLAPMSGTIRVESALGQGSTFVVELPRAASTRLKVPARERVAGTNVLVAEDDDATRHMLVRVLQANGCVVRGAPNGQRALEALLEQRPDVLVLDLMMPELDGFEVLTRLRALPGGGLVKVLVFSASELLPEQRARLEGLGAEVAVKGTVATQDVLSLVARLARDHDRSAA